jgi:carbon-monoxide dehydrogenase medium subunit
MQRQAGEYPLAALSMALKADPDGTIRDLRIAVGAVEARPRRWPALEAALIGCTPDPAALRGIARDLSDFIGRDAVDAPGWYRTRVLPGLVARAFATLTAPEGR